MSEIKSFAGRVRVAALEYHEKGRDFSAADIADKMGLQTYREKKSVACALNDLRHAGEILRLEKGVYRYIVKQRKPSKEQVMWWHLQQGAVTVEHLMLMADVLEAYAVEWLNNLLRLGVVRSYENGTYRLIDRVEEMPKNTRKAERLKGIRESKKALALALREIARARASVERANTLIEQAESDADMGFEKK